ncbi:hypothetical protein TBLA_0C04530 [Henningerozyma blattae CBS 6284]|uniref:SH3 domain-containing protein n=1 Tax=Henningerozyma blattae (strain ATCC 34711 / CBS 6284 / DSM 70876 / NBRC 10599 / NRRL Y-10934 / UCD 77-7) TaxID=1071380 RepID=I2H1J8_HENB6|nr:hypothetical protein TBLA_0C04530 [Tetrapisispora blattae CBS 6284]CCH60250.1 hypothetical protein TBLA_0C04530 [Tetrapisispora blattae CBS 6284]
MSSSLINKSLSTIDTELDFLLKSNAIDKKTYSKIHDLLPRRAPEVPSRQQSNSSKNEEWVEAIYQFDPQQDGDLQLMPGDKILVTEKPSPEWFKGKCNGKVGVFPSNYVRPAFSGSNNEKSRSDAAPPQYQQDDHHISKHSSHQSSMMPPQPYPQQQQVYQAPPPQQQQAYQAPPQQVVVEQAPAKQHHEHKHLKNFGSKLGNAAIFGAGATLGSDLVNSIF